MNRDFRTISSFLQRVWLIDRPTGRLLLQSLLQGDKTEFVEKPTEYTAAVPAKTPTAKAGLYDSYTNSIKAILSGGSSTPGTVAVIRLDYALYDWYADYICARLAEAARDENVVGILLLIDSPGGVDQAAYKIADALTGIDKPKVALCYYGLMASAAYWVGCVCDYVMASRPTDRVGSIGVYSTFFDDTGYYETLGFSLKDVYAPESSEKNLDYRKAQEGDYSLMEATNSYVVKGFVDTVTQARGKKLSKKGGDPMKGALYFAPQALSLGLLDEIGPIERAVEVISNLASGVAVETTELTGEELEEEAQEGDSNDDPKNPDPEARTPDTTTALSTAPIAPALAEASQPEIDPDQQSQLNQPPTDMFGDKHKKLSALAGVAAADITDEQLNEINAALDALNIAGVRLISTDYLAEAETAITGLATAQTTISQLTTERDTFKTQAEKFGAQPGVLGSKSEKTGEQTTPTVGEKLISEVDQELLDREAKIKRPA